MNPEKHHLLYRALRAAQRGRAIAIGKANTVLKRLEVRQRYNQKILELSAECLAAEKEYYANKERGTK